MQLGVSDAHEGLKDAIAQVFSGASWQRCRVHFTRNVLAYIPHGEKCLVSALLRTIFTQPSRRDADLQWQQVSDQMRKRWPQAAALMDDAQQDVLAYMAFPVEHWTRLYSTNPLERLNRVNLSCSRRNVPTAVLMSSASAFDPMKNCIDRGDG